MAPRSVRSLMGGLTMAAVLDAAAQVPPPGVDHYLCHQATTRAGTPASDPVERTLATALALPMTVSVKKAAMVCSPAGVGGGGILHPDTWQVAYRIRPHGGGAPVTRTLEVEDRFGTHAVEITRPDRLLVPSAAAFGAGGVPPYAGTGVRHYACWRARARGFVPPPPLDVDTWFGTADLRLRTMAALCAPADKNGEDAGAPADPGLLTCYRPRRAAFPGSQVSTHDQIRPGVLDVGRPRALCVPAIVVAASTTTTTSTPPTTIASTTTSTPASTTTTTTMVRPCGDPLSPPAPLCWGECPPEAPICVAGAVGCECIAGSTPCGSATFPACDGSCGPGQACQVSATLGCTCEFEGIPCSASFALTGICGGVCPDGYGCVGPFFTPDGDGCLCAPVGSTCHETCGADPGGGNCPPGQQCGPSLPGGPCLCQ